MGLKPCPWCGHKNAPGATHQEAVLCPNLPQSAYSRHEEQLAHVVCMCGARGPTGSAGPGKGDDAKGRAEREWNDRSRAGRGEGHP